MENDAGEPRTVEVVYAMPDEQRYVTLEYSHGLTARAAVEASGLLDSFPEIASRPLVLGIFGEAVDANHPLSPGDRVEISRPLLRDPRMLRRELLKQGHVMGVGGRKIAPD
jgi:putative ubiquitin-RnfH superfamily antitoxin RatB of RatAB toxin-antitoxin module